MKTLVRLLVSAAVLGGLLAVPVTLSAAEPAAEKAAEPTKAEATVPDQGTYRSRADVIRDQLDKRRELLAERRHSRFYGPGDAFRQWADQRHQAMQDWVDFRHEDWKRYVSARNFWNNPWAETRRQWIKQRSEAMRAQSDAIRAQMDEFHQQQIEYMDNLMPPVYSGGFYDPYVY